jgi:hypothetical protein
MAPRRNRPYNFMVFLVPRYSLQEHLAVIERDITHRICGTLDAMYEDRVLYSSSGISDDLLQVIREDKGVSSVNCDYKAYLIG